MDPARHDRLPDLPAALAELGRLALDLRWSWSHATDELWAHIAPDDWERSRSPLTVLQNASRARLEELAADPAFVADLERAVAAREDWRTRPAWFEGTGYAAQGLTCIACFSMEFGLCESLPLYSGGLGILAGDLLKTASDLGVPVVGVGLLWQQGYFRQSFDALGNQQEFFPYNDHAELPIEPVRDADGGRLRIDLPFPGRRVILRAWRVQVGRISLYLLDSNDPRNTPADRGITAELYGGAPELRLQQEICLGVGGWLLLRRLGIQPEVCHLNEGHAALAVLARAWTWMQDTHTDFRHALAATRAGNVFTTHTPVAAGFDRFPPELLHRYTEWARDAFGVPSADILALGRERPDDPAEPFNMAWLAVRGSLSVNAVSRLHGEVSRRLFQPLFPRWPAAEVPVTHVTNGVHVPSWDSAEADGLWTDACGKARWLGELEGHEAQVRSVPDEVLWALRTRSRQRLVAYARLRLQQQLANVDAPPAVLARAGEALDANTLTLGFARRFTAYKRPTLLLTDPGRLERLLTNPLRPVQLVIAGKAHPRDEAGKAMVRAWNDFIAERPHVATRVVFLADYDMAMAEQLVQGVDVWINTPRRPWEACGTSGMKILVNGGLNLSALDGWWAEACSPGVGWALGDGREHPDDAATQAADAAQLYALLEDQVVPLFYGDRDAGGTPRGWVAMVRASMATLTPGFSSNRMLRDYVEQLYLPAARRLAERRDPAAAARIVAWQDAIARHWDGVHFGELQVDGDETTARFSVPVYTGELDPAFVAVDLCAEPVGNGRAEVHPMARVAPLSGAVNGFAFAASVPRKRPVADYTPRIRPALPGAVVPLESAAIRWYA